MKNIKRTILFIFFAFLFTLYSGMIYGCKVYELEINPQTVVVSGSFTNVSYDTVTTTDFNNEIYDSDNFHSEIVNTDRITIPVGMGATQPYLISGIMTWYVTGGDLGAFTRIYIYKNNISITETHEYMSNRQTPYNYQVVTIEDIASEGDYYQFKGTANAGTGNPEMAAIRFSVTKIR